MPEHIHQIGTTGDTYTVVETDFVDLTQHPSIIDHPELFEILDKDLPQKYQKLIYEIPIDPNQEINDKIASLEADVEMLKNQ